MSGQTRRASAFEAALNVVVGYWVALAAQVVIFPLYGVHLAASEHVSIGAVFTIVSLVRSYALRRLFNRMSVKQ